VTEDSLHSHGAAEVSTWRENGELAKLIVSVGTCPARLA